MAGSDDVADVAVLVSLFALHRATAMHRNGTQYNKTKVNRNCNRLSLSSAVVCVL